MKRTQVWWTLGAALLGIWAAVGLIALASAAAEPTAQGVVDYLDQNPLDSDAAIDGLARRVNRLPFEARQDPDLRRRIDAAFQEMTPEERARYVEAVLPNGLEQMFAAINAMDSDERRKLVDDALAQMRRGRAEFEAGEAPAPPVDDAAFQRIVDEGMKAYMTDASAEAKLDLEPVVREMQSILRERRGISGARG
ncbi:MAG: hypothetical protein AAF078_08895, partial [Planctomycetota bacterium]